MQTVISLASSLRMMRMRWQSWLWTVIKTVSTSILPIHEVHCVNWWYVMKLPNTLKKKPTPTSFSIQKTLWWWVKKTVITISIFTLAEETWLSKSQKGTSKWKISWDGMKLPTHSILKAMKVVRYAPLSTKWTAKVKRPNYPNRKELIKLFSVTIWSITSILSLISTPLLSLPLMTIMVKNWQP